MALQLGIFCEFTMDSKVIVITQYFFFLEDPDIIFSILFVNVWVYVNSHSEFRPLHLLLIYFIYFKSYNLFNKTGFD